MSDSKTTRIVEISNTEGVHARAAIAIAALVRRFDAEVLLSKNSERVKGTDVLQILSLGAAPGERLLLEATGRDAEPALQALARLIAQNFHEAPP